ncbi:MAG: DUF2203 domain-containing protein [Acidobacteria bacterium]|nr:MAG: DUF2203 domain-containing protein [Acidobacteriota bacterium]
MAEKYFTREEAQELLDYVAPHLKTARDQRRRVEVLERDLAAGASRVMLLGGSIPPIVELGQKRAERDRLAGELQEAVEKVLETGCLVKDLEMGLVDFPSLRGGQEIYLCWKLGEERIQYWHGLTEGYAGRKPLDDSLPKEPPDGPVQIQ